MMVQELADLCAFTKLDLLLLFPEKMKKIKSSFKKIINKNDIRKGINRQAFQLV
jgi:hypothetical protein